MSDAHWSGLLAQPRSRVAIASRSRLLTMRDGVRIALDIHVPRSAGSGARVPAIVRQTRYLRALEVNPALRALGIASHFDLYALTRRVFLRSGYAWVDVDVRGTGASTGIWRSPWFDDEIHDGAEIVDWIIAQPWSSGRVGSLGISYDGTCSEMCSSTGTRPCALSRRSLRCTTRCERRGGAADELAKAVGSVVELALADCLGRRRPELTRAPADGDGHADERAALCDRQTA